jgi:NADH-quinone oxidoreductase E subunit
MAWKVKESGTMQVARRSEPWLTEAMLATYRQDLLPKYETTHGALMSILHDVQHTYGWIPEQAMEEIAAFLNISPSLVLDTVTFYEGYHTHPTGKCIIGVCQSIACEACGHRAVLDHIRTRLGIEPHETTADGQFTLLAMECLGACDTAPCALVNDDRHDNLSIADVDRIIDEHTA